MEPMDFPQKTKDLGAPQGWTEEQCKSLPVFNDGTQCISLWQMSLKERIEALIFGRVWLTVVSGYTQPPVSLSTQREMFVKTEEIKKIKILSRDWIDMAWRKLYNLGNQAKK